jgi:AcrR family transcriptional regulator
MATETVCVSHRERKKQATRRAIHDAAFELVEESSFSGVTIEAISERAGVAPRTFWSYFPSKEAAVLDVAAGRPAALQAALLARPADEDPLTALRRVLEVDMIDRNVDSDRALRRARLVRREPHLMAAVAATYDEIERALVAGIAERLHQDPEADLLPALYVNAACGACRAAHHRWTEAKGQPSLTELVDQAFAHLAHGLAPARQERTA